MLSIPSFRRHQLPFIALAMAALLSMGTAILKPKSQMPGEDLSLSDLATLNFEVLPIDQSLKEVGVTEKALHALCVRRLNEEHIQISHVPDHATPTLKLLIIAKENKAAAPDAKFVCVYLTLEQRVHVERLDNRRLKLPTWSTLNIQIKQPGNVELGTTTATHAVLDHFFHMIAMATAQSKS